MHEKDVVGIVTFDLIGLLLTNHIIFLFFIYLFFLRKLFTFTYYLIYFYQQTADYMQYPNTLNGYNLANSNYQLTS